MDRRDFFRHGAGALAGLGLAPLLAAAGRAGLDVAYAAGSSSPAPRDSGPGRGLVGDDGLPPRTVGLRSLGGDFAFDPAGLRVEPGDRLTWLNMGDFHTTTAFHPDNGGLLPGDVPLRIPEGAEPWHSGMLGLDAGTEFSHTFRVPGVHDYFCQPHYSFGMVGRVVVASPDGPTPTARPPSELIDAARARMPPVEIVLGDAGRAYAWSARINGVLLLRAHGEAAEAPAARLAEAMAGDRRLADLLERAGEADRARSALDRFVEAVDGGAGYETLVDRADRAKAPLSAAIESAG